VNAARSFLLRSGPIVHVQLHVNADGSYKQAKQ